MTSIEECSSHSARVLIMGDADDERAETLVKVLGKAENKIHTIIVIKYHNSDFVKVESLFPDANVIRIRATSSREFLSQFLKSIQSLSEEDIIVDISCIHTPEMFILFKCFSLSKCVKNLDAAYTVPFDYEFLGEPFTSYTSYFGDLRTTDLVGFGGISNGLPHSKMVVFMGFEGVLSSKVTEDIQFEDLLFVNNLPSYFPKYKDIGVINNYELLSTRNKKIHYVPADNPFETYNFLSSLLGAETHVCIAPLSTKPVALGVCLYALRHREVRVVYPVSKCYKQRSTKSILNTYLYRIPLSAL